MASVNGGTLTLARSNTTLFPSGDCLVVLNYVNASGVVVHARALTIKGDGSAVVDQFGTVVATPVPAALANAVTAFASQLDTSIANGATAGKLNL